MIVIVAGSRSIKDYSIVKKTIEESGWKITYVVSGKAPGVDTLGEQWADENGVKVKPFPANWSDINVPGAVVRKNKYGYYNAVAGHLRNEEMAKVADALILVWDGVSTGSADMKSRAKKHKLRIFVYNLKTNTYSVE